MDWNKDHIRETMLSLETAALQSARDKYLDYVSTARLDRSEPIENDEQAQAEIASDFAEALDDTLDDYADKLDKLRTIDFGPKTAVAEGAVIKLSGRYFVVAVSTEQVRLPWARAHGHIDDGADLRGNRRGSSRRDRSVQRPRAEGRSCLIAKRSPGPQR